MKRILQTAIIVAVVGIGMTFVSKGQHANELAKHTVLPYSSHYYYI